MSENDLRKKQVAGFYVDIELTPGYNEETEVEKKERELEGVKRTRDEDIFTVLEIHVDLDLEGFEDKDSEGETEELNFLIFLNLEAEKYYQLEETIQQKIQLNKNKNILYTLSFYLEWVFMVLV